LKKEDPAVKIKKQGRIMIKKFRLFLPDEKSTGKRPECQIQNWTGKGKILE